MEIFRLKPYWKQDHPRFEAYADEQINRAMPVLKRIEDAGYLVSGAIRFDWASINVYDGISPFPIAESSGINDLDWHAEEAFLLAREYTMHRES